MHKFFLAVALGVDFGNDAIADLSRRPDRHGSRSIRVLWLCGRYLRKDCYPPHQLPDGTHVKQVHKEVVRQDPRLADEDTMHSINNVDFPHLLTPKRSLSILNKNRVIITSFLVILQNINYL